MKRGSIHSLRMLTVSPLPAPSTPPIRTITGKLLFASSSYWAFSSASRSLGSCRSYSRSGMRWPSSADSNMVGLLHQHDIELLLIVLRFDLQRHRLADEVRKHRQTLRFLVEEEIDHLLGGEYPELTGLELARLAQQFAQNLVAHRLRGLEFAPPLADRARFAQHMREAFARALARHLHEAQLGKAVHRHARAVARQCLAELVEHGVAVLFRIHVDEVDDDDAAEVPQPQLARDHLRRLQIGLEYRVVEAADPDEAAGVDVDCRQRFGLVDNQVAAGLEIDPPRQRLLDFSLDAVEFKKRPRAGIMLEPRGDIGCEFERKGLHLLERFAGIDQDARRFIVGEIAQHAQAQIEV